MTAAPSAGPVRSWTGRRSRVAVVCAAACTGGALAAPRGVWAQHAVASPDPLPAALDSAFAFARGPVPGCAVGVARPGRPALLRAYGRADLTHGVPNTPETVFESGSVANGGALAGERAVSRGGSTAGYKTWLGRVPARGVSVAVLRNHEPGRALAPADPGRFRLPDGRPAAFVLGGGRGREARLAAGGDTARLAPVPPPDTAGAALAAYAGTYRSAELDARLTVEVRGGALVWRQPFGVERPLRAAFAGAYTTPLRGGTVVVFTRDAAGRVDGLGVWAPGVRALRFARE